MRLLTLKRAGDGYIIRLKNPNASPIAVNIETGFKINSVYTTNLLERNMDNLFVDSNSVSFSIQPYAIKTVRFIPASPNEEPGVSWLIVFPNPALGEVYFSSELSGSIEIDFLTLGED